MQSPWREWRHWVRRLKFSGCLFRSAQANMEGYVMVTPVLQTLLELHSMGATFPRTKRVLASWKWVLYILKPLTQQRGPTVIWVVYLYFEEKAPPPIPPTGLCEEAKTLWPCLSHQITIKPTPVLSPPPRRQPNQGPAPHCGLSPGLQAWR